MPGSKTSKLGFVKLNINEKENKLIVPQAHFQNTVCNYNTLILISIAMAIQPYVIQFILSGLSLQFDHKLFLQVSYYRVNAIFCYQYNQQKKSIKIDKSLSIAFAYVEAVKNKMCEQFITPFPCSVFIVLLNIPRINLHLISKI